MNTEDQGQYEQSEQVGFRLLTEADLTPAVVAQMQLAHPDLAVLKGWLEAVYKAQTGTDPVGASSIVQKSFAAWLNRQLESNVPCQFRRWPRLEVLLHGSFSSKVNNLAQRHCYVCAGARPPGDMFPVNIIPVRITPKSRQAMEGEMFKAFQTAVAHWFAGRTVDLGVTGKVCMAVTFVLRGNGRDKDLDNMVKAFQDALSRALGFDDRDIQHLDVVKLILPTVEEYLYVRLAPSALNEHGDVVAPVLNHVFATGQALDLDNFLPRSGSGRPVV